MKIRFNQAFYTQKTIPYILDAFQEKHVSGDGKYSKLCHSWLQERFNCQKALLTHSCTGALEMSAILADIGQGDEVIMPSYTFVSTANAFVLRGAKPVFVDIRPDTLNIDENLLEQAITNRTKAIIPVHYAGVACEMDMIMKIAKKYNLLVIEDAAQAFGSEYKNKALGTIGDIGSLSFHETKNIMSGEGGAILINDQKFNEDAEIIREKGTNRSKFFRGNVDKYTWVNIGSSYLPSDIIAAYLYSAFEVAEEVTAKRLEIWNKYYEIFVEYEKRGIIKCPTIPQYCKHNGHIFYLIFTDLETRTAFIQHLKQNEILATFHYIPLHSAPAGIKFGRFIGDMKVTNMISDNLVRIPLFYDLDNDSCNYVIEKVTDFLKRL